MKRLSALIPVFLAQVLSATAASRPNVILVMTDDQGYGDLRCHGNAMIQTPNLDRFHADSVRFTDFHVDPTCSPTRAALLTGRYSTRTGVWHTIMGRSILFRDEVTLGGMFQRAGYRTGIFGKWHLGDNHPSRPQDRGFEEVLIHGGGGVGQTPDWWGNDYFDDTFLHNGEWKPFEGYCTKVFFDGALKFVEQNRKRPFFLYLPTNVPHSPNHVAEEYSRPYVNQGVPENMARFYGMITEFDENFGRLLARLDELNLAENTIVIFMTDNGTAAGVPRARPNQKGGIATWAGFNAGMRAQKGSPYDGGHRVPFFIRWPAGAIGGGRDVSQLAAHLDVLPTLAELCGVPPPAGRALDGRSLVPLLQGRTSGWPDRTLFVHTQREEIPPKWVRSAALTSQWRLVDGKELYDIKADPGQARDLAQTRPEVVTKLREEYEAWWKSLEPAFTEHGWIVIGSESDPVSRINCMDWHAAETRDIPWHHGQIEAAPWANGYWMVEFEQAGTYQFTLRQRPAVAQFPIEGTLASVSVASEEVTTAIPAGATAVTLTMNVAAGRTRMQTRFTDEANGKSRGAFYVEVQAVR